MLSRQLFRLAYKLPKKRYTSNSYLAMLLPSGTTLCWNMVRDRRISRVGALKSIISLGLTAGVVCECVNARSASDVTLSWQTVTPTNQHSSILNFVRVIYCVNTSGTSLDERIGISGRPSITVHYHRDYYSRM